MADERASTQPPRVLIIDDVAVQPDGQHLVHLWGRRQPFYPEGRHDLLERFMVDALNASYSFANTLQKDDWVAVISYDMKPQILADFTQDKRSVYAALNQLRMPGFAETNLFDALFDTLDRLDRIEGFGDVGKQDRRVIVRFVN